VFCFCTIVLRHGKVHQILLYDSIVSAISCYPSSYLLTYLWRHLDAAPAPVAPSLSSCSISELNLSWFTDKTIWSDSVVFASIGSIVCYWCSSLLWLNNDVSLRQFTIIWWYFDLQFAAVLVFNHCLSVSIYKLLVPSRLI